MKLLFIIPEYPPHFGGGIATFYRHLLPALAMQGHQVTVLVSNAFSSSFPNYQAEGIQVICLDQQKVTANLRKFDRYSALPEFKRHLATAWAAWEQVEGGQGFDIVETVDWGMLFAPWVVSSESPPTVVQLHGSLGQIDAYDPQLDSQLQGQFARLLELNLLAIADELQANSQENAEFWSQLTGKSVAYIPPALKVDYSPVFSEKSDRGLAIGRIQYWKGPTILCEALQLLGNKAPEIDWVGRDMAYQCSNQSMSHHLAKTYPTIWGSIVRPINTLPFEETLKLQANARFMVVPSVWDVFNYTCIEGMAQGQVVLCSEGAGAAELITNGVNGFTFTANNPKALADCLGSFLSLNPSHQQKIGEAAQHSVQTQLNPEKIAQQHLERYAQLIEQGKSPNHHNPWLQSAISPSQVSDDSLAFLDRLPLRELSRYVLDRSIKKLRK